MGVRARQRRARDAKPLHVHRVGHTVARLGIPQPEPLAGRPQEQVVGHVPFVGLQQIVIHVLHRHLRAGAVQAERLQFQHHHGAGRILSELLVDPHPDLTARSHLTGRAEFGDARAHSILENGQLPRLSDQTIGRLTLQP